MADSKTTSKNDYREFYPYIQNEIDCYKEATLQVQVSTRSGKTITETRSYPRIQNGSEIYYNEFMGKITNPTSRKFYSQRDKNGNEIQQPDGINAKYVIKTIVRLRRSNGEEVLYSRGQIQGFNSLGSAVTCNCDSPEVWEKPVFGVERKFDQKTNTVQELVKNISGKETIYELPYSPENVERLYQSAVGINGNKLQPSNRYHDLSLVVKDEKSGLAIEVSWSSPEETRKLFRDKPFEYLFNSQYIPEPVKAELRAKSIGLTNNQPIEIPDLTPDKQNYKQFTK